MRAAAAFRCQMRGARCGRARASGAQRKAQRGVRADACQAQRRVVRHGGAAEAEALRVHRHAPARLRAARRRVSTQQTPRRQTHGRAEGARGGGSVSPAPNERSCKRGSCSASVAATRRRGTAEASRTCTACFREAPVASTAHTSNASVPHGELSKSCISRFGSGAAGFGGSDALGGAALRPPPACSAPYARLAVLQLGAAWQARLQR